jgi:hypothetical protein
VDAEPPAHSGLHDLLDDLVGTISWTASNITPILAVTSLLLYAGFWTDSLIFYSRLGVGPEDVGLGPAEILGRSVTGFIVLGGVTVLLAVFAATAFAPLAFGLRALIRVSLGRRSQAIDAAIVLIITTVALVLAAISANDPATKTLLISVVLLCALGCYVWITGHAWRHMRTTAVVLIAAAVLSTFALTTSLALTASASIRGGQAVQFRIGDLPVTPWEARPVALTWSAQAPTSLRSAQGNCAIYLGEAGGRTALYLTSIHEVLRVPSSFVVIQTFPEVLACAAGNEFRPPPFYPSS